MMSCSASSFLSTEESQKKWTKSYKVSNFLLTDTGKKSFVFSTDCDSDFLAVRQTEYLELLIYVYRPAS